MLHGIPNYKEVTLQQLRSLCETARQGSFLAAAASLGLSQPTVWKQVHALEREFGARLVEPHGRGCNMTSAGRLLVEMIGPAVESIASVRERFRAALAEEGEQLAVAVTPRMVLDEMALCVAKSHDRSPKTRFTFLELSDEEVPVAVLERQADFGFTPSPLKPEHFGVLSLTPAYRLEVRLIAPKNHPLARQRRVRLSDLSRYPIINRPPAGGALARFLLDLHGSRRGARSLLQAGFASSIRGYVKMGYGIGLLTVPPSTQPDPDLHERPMRHSFEEITVGLICRRGGFITAEGEAFIRLVCEELGAGRPRSNGAKGRK
jgi:DNA-binding transcriptional LysR family regulator